MKRTFLYAFSLSLMLAMPANAAPSLKEIVAQLEAQGYSDISISRTWLGRTRIEAENGTHEREIIFNQRTGEILRDFWEEQEDDNDSSSGSRTSDDAEDDASETEEDDDTGNDDDDDNDSDSGDDDDGDDD